MSGASYVSPIKVSARIGADGSVLAGSRGIASVTIPSVGFFNCLFSVPRKKIGAEYQVYVTVNGGGTEAYAQWVSTASDETMAQVFIRDAAGPFNRAFTIMVVEL